MKKSVRTPLIALALVIFLTVSAVAQNFTIPPGESLEYEGKVSKIIQGIAVADLTFQVEKDQSGKNLVIKTDAKSKGSLIKIFRFSFLQQYTSTIDIEKFRILRTIKRDVQKERVRDSDAVFDYQNGQVTYVETDPKDPMRAPRKIASEVKGEVHDLVSGIYALRRLPLAVGKTFEITVSDSGLVYTVPVRVTRRERQTTVLGKVWCFRLEPEVFGTNRLIEQEGSMIIWITEDSRRLPVRSQIKVNLGKIEVKLRKATSTPQK